METYLCRSLIAAVAVGSFAAPAMALDGGTLRVQTYNGWRGLEIISQGDNPSGDGQAYSMPGAFDGIGAFLADSATLRVLVNHETGDASISEVDLDLGNLRAAMQRTIETGSTGGYAFVKAARQAYSRISYDGGRSFQSTSSASNTSLERFCSGQSYAPDTFGRDRGFVDALYITGEEVDGGRLFALDSVRRDLYQLNGNVGSARGGIGGMPFDSFENAALIDTGETGHIALLLSPDGGTQSMMLYVGEKGRNASGGASNGFLARNGLAYGSWYYLNGSLAGSVGSSRGGSFDISASGALAASKMEDVDTSPDQPTRVVLGNQSYGVFTFDFDLVFNPGFNATQSSFAITKIDGTDGGLGSADNVDWTRGTRLSSTSYPDGLIFVNEDNSSGEIWMMRPDGSGQTRIGQTTVGSESTGILDVSELVGYAPGSVVLTNNQGSPASMTLLIHPQATALEAAQCGDGICETGEDASNCADDCASPCVGGTCPDTCTSRLESGDTLRPNDRRCSPNGQFHFTLQTDGNLVLYAGERALWAVGITSGASRFARMQSDGNLVLRDAAESALWSSRTHGNPGAFLSVENDGRAVIRLGSTELWAVGGNVPADLCPNDPEKTAPGECGCGIPEGSCGGDPVAQHLVLAPVADTYVDESRASSNFGGAATLLVDAAPERFETLLRFRVPALTAPVRRATLRLFVSNGSDNGPEVYRAANAWSESAVTWSNRPATVGARLTDLGNTPEGWLEVDVTAAITNAGDHSFLLRPGGDNGVDFHSREASSRPELVVDTGEAGVPPQSSTIRHIGTTQVWDADGENVRIARPSGSQVGDLLVLVLHRTDDYLPLYVDGWERAAECYKRDNGYDCSTEADCTSWLDSDYCRTFGSYGQGGRDLAQAVFYRTMRAGEAGSYEFDMNPQGTGHPGWIFLTALRGAASNDPVRDWSNTGCDNNPDSVFPSVYGQKGDMVLLSQSFDDAIAQSVFGAPSGTQLFGYVSNSDEAGFLFGGVLGASGETGTMKTQGSGASNCKDALVSLTIRPQQ